MGIVSDIHGPDALATLIGVGIALLALVALLAQLRLHSAPDGPNPLRGSVGAYGAGRHRSWYQAGSTAIGGASGATAWAIARLVQPAPWSALVLLFVFGAARVADAAVAADLPGASPTPRGRIHLALSAVATVALPAAAVVWSLGASRGSEWGDVATPLGWVAGALAVFAAGTLGMRAGRGRAWPGLLERLGALCGIVWFVVMAVGVIHAGRL